MLRLSSLGILLIWAFVTAGCVTSSQLAEPSFESGDKHRVTAVQYSGATTEFSCLSPGTCVVSRWGENDRYEISSDQRVNNISGILRWSAVHPGTDRLTARLAVKTEHGGIMGHPDFPQVSGTSPLRFHWAAEDLPRDGTGYVLSIDSSETVHGGVLVFRTFHRQEFEAVIEVSRPD